MRRCPLQDPPNDGTTTAVGGLGLDASGAVLDVVTDATGASAGLAILTTGGTSGLYAIDLATGSASLAGTLALPAGETARGLAIQNPPNAGTQIDVGALEVDIAAVDGFEIDGRDNAALVALALAGGTATTLHTIDLTSGKVSPSLGVVGGGERLRGLARPAPATTVFGLLETDQLVAISLANPATPTAIGPVTGLATGETLLGIDVRPNTGVLHGLGSLGGLYAIDPATAAATRISTLAADPTDTTNPFTALSGVEFGVDFNPTGPVALRVVSDAEQNLRIPSVLNGATFTDLDLNSTALPAPDVVAAAYTNSFPGATATTLFVIDAASGQLATQSPPNNGVLTPVGALSASTSFAGRAAFDIGGGANGVALAALQRAGTGETFSRLYRVDLTTGAATEVGAVGNGPALRGLAIRIR